jgi:4-hydroxyphenylacetate 3-monooxygenase
MLKSGEQHLESLRDGRVIYIGSEKITDVTTHPAFRNTAQTVAMLYDIKADPANRAVAAFEEDGELYSTYFFKPKTRDDLARRTKAHKFWGDASYGLFGRSGDHMAGWITALAMQPEVMPKPEFGRNIGAYYDFMRKNDTFLVYAVLPPQAARDPEFYARANIATPTLRVTGEDDNGVTLNGMKMLATSAVFANELWIGNVLPLAPTQVKESITCAIPVATPGVTLWSRKSFEREAQTTFDNPLSSRFDETDSMVLFDNVKVPWERVFVHDDVSACREIYHKSAAHRFGNHQSNVRFLSKLQLLLGIASKVTVSNNAREIPAVREVLGKLAAMEGMLAGVIAGQSMDYDDLGNGYVSFNRRYMYAGLQWCTDNYNEITAIVRELCGGGVFQMPADSSILDDAALARTFEQYWRTPTQSALDRMKLFKLAWDLLGSEFGGRHLQYEKFYAGPPFLVRNYNYTWAPWATYDAIVDDLMAQYDVPVMETVPHA